MRYLDGNSVKTDYYFTIAQQQNRVRFRNLYPKQKKNAFWCILSYTGVNVF